MYTLLYFHINIQNKCILIDWFKLGGIQSSTGKIWYNKLGLQIFLYNRTSVIPNNLILIRNRCTQYIPGRFHDIFRTNDTRPVLIISFFSFYQNYLNRSTQLADTRVGTGIPTAKYVHTLSLTSMKWLHMIHISGTNVQYDTTVQF